MTTLEETVYIEKKTFQLLVFVKAAASLIKAEFMYNNFIMV